MKLALITDTHFGARNDSPAFAKYFERFYSEIFFPYLDEHNITTVIHLGDIVDRRKYINYTTARQLEESLIKPLCDRNIDTHMLIGNHDTYYKNTNEVNSMRELYGSSKYSNLHFYSDKPTVVNFDGCDILLTPWICTENLRESLHIIKHTSAQVLFGHLEIKGFEMYRGSINDHGFDRSVFDKFDVVCSGHFHHRSTDGTITYLGSPYEMFWNDFEDPRGFNIFDTDTRELTFVQNPLTMFEKVLYDDTDKILEQVVNQNFEQYNNKFVKVIVKEKNNPYWFDLFIDKLEKSGPFSVQVVEDHLNLNLESDDDIINEAEDTMTILSKYIDALEITTDKKRVENTIRDLYDQALSIS